MQTQTQSQNRTRNRTKTEIQIDIGDALLADSEQHSLKFQEHVLSYHADAPTAVPLGMMVVALMVAYFAHDSAHPIIWVTWTVSFMILNVLRLWYLARVQRSQDSVSEKLERCIFLALVDGCASASAFMFFPAFSFAERSTLTLMGLGLISGAVITTNGYSKILMPYAVPVIGVMTMSWALVPMHQVGFPTQMGITSLILIFFAAQLSMSRRYLLAVQQAFSVREEHRSLNNLLNQKLKSSISNEEQLTELNVKLNNALNDAVKAMR